VGSTRIFQSLGPATERLRNERMIVESKPDLVAASPVEKELPI
jgi:hypothetical protein